MIWSTGNQSILYLHISDERICIASENFISFFISFRSLNAELIFIHQMQMKTIK